MPCFPPLPSLAPDILSDLKWFLSAYSFHSCILPCVNCVWKSLRDPFPSLFKRLLRWFECYQLKSPSRTTLPQNILIQQRWQIWSLCVTQCCRWGLTMPRLCLQVSSFPNFWEYFASWYPGIAMFCFCLENWWRYLFIWSLDNCLFCQRVQVASGCGEANWTMKWCWKGGNLSHLFPRARFSLQRE